jgi:glycosyltransferase involved in cell wall biosynthesis
LKTILFISHDATRTGAPILLLNLQKALKGSYNREFLLKNGGELESAFINQAPTITPYRSPETIYKKINYKLNSDKLNYNLSLVDWAKYDLVISNTITNGDILPFIRNNYKGKIVSYIHELEMATNFFTSDGDLKSLVKCSDAYLAPSIAVKEHLINNLLVDENKISLLSYYIEPSGYIKSVNIKSNRDFIVGGIGTADWRKSPDLFIIIAKTVMSQRPDANIKFHWTGGNNHSVEKDRLLYDIKKSGLNNVVTLFDSTSNLSVFYASISVFLLSSREDPYPLVVLQAADQEIPTICFKGAGGSPDFVEESGGGVVIPYLDVEAAAQAILKYYDDLESLTTDGKSAKKMLSETHQNIEFFNNQFSTFVHRILN